MSKGIPAHRAEPIHLGDWEIRAECRICDFYGVRTVIQRSGLFRRWRHIL